MDFDNSRPIWLQLLDEFKRLIAAGTWQPEQRVPSVRELAGQYGVNPNTVQRSLTELERLELCITERTTGRFVTDSTGIINQLRTELAQQAAASYVREAQGLEIDQPTAIELINKAWPKETT